MGGPTGPNDLAGPPPKTLRPEAQTSPLEGIKRTFGEAPKEGRRLPKNCQGATNQGVRSPQGTLSQRYPANSEGNATNLEVQSPLGPPRGSLRVSRASWPRDTPHAAKDREHQWTKRINRMNHG